MTEPTIKNISGARVELQFSVSPEEAQPYIDQAAKDLQSNKPIKGFRPGKAPFDAIKAEFGEMRIWETALERIVRAKYVHALLEKKIESIGSPEIQVDQLVPGQDIRFTVRAPIMPSADRIADYDKIIVKKEIPSIDVTAVDNAVRELQKMRRKEVIADIPATKESMVEINMEMKKDGVIIEDGTANKYRVYLSEPHYIPGFTEQLVGMKRGEEKTFDLELPKEHYNKSLAGKPIAFTIKVNDVYELALPEVDTAFAEELGFTTVALLREKIEENMRDEAKQRAEESAEIELLETLIKGSSFSEIPELLVNEEVRRMFNELTQSAEAQGMNVTDYFSQLKKTPDEIKLDMVPRALDRIKTAVLIRAIGKKEGIDVTDEELDTEVDRILEATKEPDLRERVSSPDYRDYLATQMKNHKTIELLREKTIELTSK
ncbi:MAG: trigger factor [bacterium]|nr:trigger factor [bacterium]